MPAPLGKPRKPGGSPDRKALKRLYVVQGLSVREIASRLGLHPGTVHYWLKKRGIETRTRAKRSCLGRLKLSTLEAGVKAQGIRGYARVLGIDESTLRHHLRVRRCGNRVA